jgi:hypothetical protein
MASATKDNQGEFLPEERARIREFGNVSSVTEPLPALGYLQSCYTLDRAARALQLTANPDVDAVGDRRRIDVKDARDAVVPFRMFQAIAARCTEDITPFSL